MFAQPGRGHGLLVRGGNTRSEAVGAVVISERRLINTRGT